MPSPFRLGASPPAQIRMEIRRFSGPRAAPFLTQLALAWLVILGSIAVAAHLQTWWVTALTVLIVSSRQNVLGLLVHEQAHKLGIQGRKGDILTNFLAGYPLVLISVEKYANVHLAHHKYYFTDKDPDHLRKSGDEWATPKSRRDFFKLLVKDVLGMNTLSLARGKGRAAVSQEFMRAKPTPKAVKAAYFLTLASVLTYFDLWPLFLLYWVLPILTVSQLIVRWGALTEHIYNTPNARVEENTPLVIPSMLNRILLPNLNFSFHAYHHWHPNVSFSNLPKVHALYLKYDLIEEKNVFHGYGAFLKFMLRDREGRAETADESKSYRASGF